MKGVAFASKLRGGFITQDEHQRARTDLANDCEQQYFLMSVETQRIDEAIELTARQKLRGYDAIHLACALYFNQILLQNALSPLGIRI